MIPDRGIREMVWPTNDALPTVYVPSDRNLLFFPISESQIQPVSLDVRLANDLIRHPSGEKVRMGELGYSMAPGECLLGTLVERFRMGADNVVGQVEGKSSWARQFLTIHAAGLIDPGFEGDITLEMKNDGHARIQLYPGTSIAQITFTFTSAPVQRMYGSVGLGSHYQDQAGPTPSWRQH